VRVGVLYFPTDYGIDIRELARAAEERGLDSLLLPEHTHIPKSRRTPYPGGGELPTAYSHTHDPFVALSFAAAATTKILLGTGIWALLGLTWNRPSKPGGGPIRPGRSFNAEGFANNAWMLVHPSSTSSRVFGQIASGCAVQDLVAF